MTSEQEAYRAGERFVRANEELFTAGDVDVESYATDLAASLGLDAECVAEGMRDELERREPTSPAAKYGVPLPCLEEAKQLVERYAFGAEADAGFDGGEFSGPANADALEKAIDALAKRYGVSADAVWDATNAEQAAEEWERRAAEMHPLGRSI